MEILFSKSSKKQLEKLNPRFRQKIIFNLERFKDNKPVDVIKLKNKNDEFRIRIGNYRIQLKKVIEGFLVTKIGKRENFYLIFL